jgi:plastocyanin
MKTKFVAYVNAFMLLALFAVLGTTGCKSDSNPYTTNGGGGGGGTPGATEVWMQGTAFVPASKTIAVGTTITWTNKDAYAHWVASGVPGAPDGIFNSGSLSNGGTYSFKFITAGTFKYYCMIHGAMMTAVMIVQ